MPDTAAATVDIPPPPPRPAARPAWQRHPFFKFFASVKLAVILLAVLIAASIAGTLYETSFDARVARAYIYNAWWFNAWLTLLCANLACAAFSRMPWKRHHTGFLITHLGIIILLGGAMIGRAWGIEGTMTIFKGQPPNNQLVVDQRVLRVEEGGSAAQYPVNIMGRKPTPDKPWTLGRTPQGWTVALIGYAPLIDAAFEARPVPASGGGGQPAVHVRLVTKRMNQTLDTWLITGDPEHDTLDLAGMASVKLRRGVAPASASEETAPANAAISAEHSAVGSVDESVMAFALKPHEQVAQPAPGTSPSGAKVRLTVDASGKKQVFIDWRGATWNFDPVADRGKEEDLGGSGQNVTILDYWPDFVLGANGQPSNASDEPRNPAVLVRIHGSFIGDGKDDVEDGRAADAIPRGMSGNSGARNQAIVYCDAAGKLTFTLKNGASPVPVRGTLPAGESINTGWADWQLQAAAVLPTAVGQTTFHPVKDTLPPTTGDDGGGNAPMSNAGNHAEGVRVRLSKNGESHEEWATAGWQVTLPTTPQATRLAFDFLIESLPIGLELQNFDVQFNEGTNDPSSFRSFVKVTDADGAEATGSCSMNHPFNYPGHWWNTFSGQTFKMSQASWNPDNLKQSTVQILRDPGWLCKWVGSLLICAGIFTMFYLRPPRTSGTAP